MLVKVQNLQIIRPTQQIVTKRNKKIIIDNKFLPNRIRNVAETLGRRQVGRQLVLVQPSRRFESFRPRIKKYPPRSGYFFVLVEMVRTLCSNRASELRLECFCRRLKICRQNTELPLHANEQDTSAPEY